MIIRSPEQVFSVDSVSNPVSPPPPRGASSVIVRARYGSYNYCPECRYGGAGEQLMPGDDNSARAVVTAGASMCAGGEGGGG